MYDKLPVHIISGHNALPGFFGRTISLEIIPTYSIYYHQPTARQPARKLTVNSPRPVSHLGGQSSNPPARQSEGAPRPYNTPLKMMEAWTHFQDTALSYNNVYTVYITCAKKIKLILTTQNLTFTGLLTTSWPRLVVQHHTMLWLSASFQVFDNSCLRHRGLQFS